MTIWPIHFAFWLTKAANTPSEYVILLLLCNGGYANASQCVTFYVHDLSCCVCNLFNDTTSNSVYITKKQGIGEKLMLSKLCFEMYSENEVKLTCVRLWTGYNWHGITSDRLLRTQ